MLLKNKSEKSREIPKKKSRPTRSRKRENPKRPDAPAKRGAASEVTASSKSKKKLIEDEYGFYKNSEGDIVKDGPVMKAALTGVGDFWRQHLPKIISVYGSFDDDFFPETGSRREKRKWVELRVQELLDSRKDDEMRIRNLEKVICHLLDALKK